MSTKSIAIGTPVSYQYSKAWLRYGKVIEKDGERARVLWAREIYCGNAAGVQDRDLNIRTWVNVSRLKFVNL